MRNVLEAVGPPDATIIIQGLEATDELLSSLKNLLEEEAGAVVLTRIHGGNIYVTFRDSVSALNALNLSGTSLLGQVLNVELKTPNWVQVVMKGLEESAVAVIPLPDENAIIDIPEEELETSLGPEFDPHVFCADLEDSESISGRNSPCTLLLDGPDKSGTPSPVSEAKKPLPNRPAPPSKPDRPVKPLAPDSPKLKPQRPAPPPPLKAPLHHQQALNPPTIMKTAPSTDSEASFEREAPASPSSVPAPKPDPLVEATVGWHERDAKGNVSPGVEGDTRDMPSVPPPPPPPATCDDSIPADESFKSSPPKMPPPPAPTTNGLIEDTRGPPPPVPARNRPVVPPRKNQT